MKPAPLFDCAHCGRRIGKTAAHWRTETPPFLVACSRCVSKLRAWDDYVQGSRAGIAHTMGLWP